MALVLYTQPRCNYCDVMKKMLDEIGHNYRLVDIFEDKKGLDFIKEKGHRTTPQLYWNGAWVNQNKTTMSLSPTELDKLIEQAMESERTAGFNGA
tara:strand:- start:195 stop:479 length:285 start_codon:yes stop_codon:yes gene_type:complete